MLHCASRIRIQRGSQDSLEKTCGRDRYPAVLPQSVSTSEFIRRLPYQMAPRIRVYVFPASLPLRYVEDLRIGWM